MHQFLQYEINLVLFHTAVLVQEDDILMGRRTGVDDSGLPERINFHERSISIGKLLSNQISMAIGYIYQFHGSHPNLLR